MTWSRRVTNLGTVLGPGSTFSLDGDEHRERRKLLVPPFHGKRMVGYEAIVEEEVMREIANWPQGREFETLEPMMRITLNAILRAVFGAQGTAFDELRQLLPPMVPLASRMAVLPPAFRKDFGPWSPWGRVQRSRRRYDEIMSQLIAEARSDPAFEDRNDVLALMLRARYEDGSPISDGHVADELLTLLAAGHETTATTLAWTIERLRRHPRLLSRLTAEVDAGGTELTQATIWEVQRTRPVIEATARLTRERIRLGEWVIPKGHAVIASITMAHQSEDNFADAADVQSGPIPRRQPGHAYLDSLRRRHPSMHRRRLRQHGDERDTANVAARVRIRHHLRRGGAASLPRGRHRTGARRPGGRVPSACRCRPADVQRRDEGVGMTAHEAVVDVGRGIELCYDQTGDHADPPLILIGGLGQQLHSWPDDFVAALAGRGYCVTRFDNRDAGRSTHMTYRPPNPVAMFRGGDRRHQYHLGDMARDTVGLMDALGYADAHLVGVSMGGMIAQTVAAHHPRRVRTLTSIMSTTGARRLGRPALSTWRRMLTSRPPRTRAEAMDRAADIFSHIGSHGFPFDEHAVREYAGIAWDRDPSPEGIARQLTAIFASGDRTAELAPDRRADPGHSRRPRPDGPSHRRRCDREGDTRCPAGDDRRPRP